VRLLLTRLDEHFGPESLTVLATYQCTAACKECCFECGPHLRERLPREVILDVIRQAAQFKTLRYVVFSGGECFLLHQDLIDAVALASSFGLSVRCVTNGYWAVNEQAALARLKPLVEAGLTELNISTGDDHQEYVPFQRVITGAMTAARLGIKTLIVVEGSKNSKFKAEDARNHPDFLTFKESDPAGDNLSIISNVWIPFHEDRQLVHEKSLIRNPDENFKVQGCDNILENFVLTPSHQMASCCGLTMEHIPEMKLGDVRKHPIKELYFNQFEDFLKIWIYVDGPERIIRFAQKHNQSIRVDNTVHPCQACATLYLRPEIRKTLKDNYQEVIDDVMRRFYLKLALRKYTEKFFRESPGIKHGA